jgi:hypothetical protein
MAHEAQALEHAAGDFAHERIVPGKTRRPGFELAAHGCDAGVYAVGCHGRGWIVALKAGLWLSWVLARPAGHSGRPQAPGAGVARRGRWQR